METLSLTVSQTATHYLYIRRHQSGGSGKDANLPAQRTLFAVNLPLDASERQIAQFFKTHSCGTVERVVFGGSYVSVATDDTGDDIMGGDQDEQPVASTSKVVPLPALPPALLTSGTTAHVVFLDSSSVHHALSLPSKSSKKRLRWPAASPPSSATDSSTGLARLIASYEALHPPRSTSRLHADTFMEYFEQQQEAAKLASIQNSKYKKGEAVVDDDGFTLVTRGGAYGATLGGGAAVASRKFQIRANSGGINESEKNKRKAKEKKDFYTFQVREQKRKDFMDLRKKFEEDKEKIAKLKESRRFKPY